MKVSQFFEFREISVDETTKIIGRLSNSTAFGIDQIDALSVKAAAVHLVKPINHLINVSLTSGVYANRWKIAKILPLLKDKDLDRLNPASYRPVAILPTLSKLVERAAHLQLLDFLETTNQLNPNSHAYRVGYSTTTTLMEVTGKLYDATERREMSSVMTIDQQAAFDCVAHQVLLEKLKLYKVGDEALKWFSCYLVGRSHFVNVGRADSRMVSLEQGVPQGSILGPLLYSVYTNELTECTRDPACRNLQHLNTEKLFDENCLDCGVIDQYADDTTFTISSKQRTRNQKKLEENLERISMFLTSNYLSINMGKTKIIEMMIKQKRGRTPGSPPKLNVRINVNERKEIEDMEVCRILGMNLQKNITWRAHLESGPKALLPSVRRCLGALKHTGRLIPEGSRNVLVKGLVTGRLAYLIGIWGGTTPNLRRKAQQVLNTAARWVTKSPRSTRVSSLMEKAGWFSVNEMVELSTATLLWKIIYKKTPVNMNSKMDWDPTSRKIIYKEPRLKFTDQDFMTRGSRQWNNLPDHIRGNESLVSFKKQMKELMLERRQREPD